MRVFIVASELSQNEPYPRKLSKRSNLQKYHERIKTRHAYLPSSLPHPPSPPPPGKTATVTTTTTIYVYNTSITVTSMTNYHYKGYHVASVSNDPDLKKERKKTKPKCDAFGRRESCSIPYIDLHIIVHGDT